MPAQKSFFPQKSSSKVVLDGACALGRPFFCSNGRKQEERSVKAGRLRPMRFDRAAPPCLYSGVADRKKINYFAGIVSPYREENRYALRGVEDVF